MFQFVLEAPSNAIVGDDKTNIQYNMINLNDTLAMIKTGATHVVLTKNQNRVIEDPELTIKEIRDQRADLSLTLNGNKATVTINSITTDLRKKVARGQFDFYVGLCVWCPKGNYHKIFKDSRGYMYRNFGYLPFLLTPLGKFDGSDKKRSYTFDINIKHLPKINVFNY